MADIIRHIRNNKHLSKRTLRNKILKKIVEKKILHINTIFMRSSITIKISQFIYTFRNKFQVKVQEAFALPLEI